jgi:hypothetical protein
VTLAFSEQNRLAEQQPEYRNRFAAGAFAAAVAAYGQTPNVDPVKQAQRMALVNALIRDPNYAAGTFAWVVVSRPTLNVETDITDTFIATTITNTFDTIASQLFIGTT